LARSTKQSKTPRRWLPLRAQLGCVSLVALALAGTGVAADPKVSHTELSANGKFGIRLRQLGKGECQVEILRGNTPDFVLNKCVGTVDDLYFISNDGSRFWTLYVLPRKSRFEQTDPIKENDQPTDTWQNSDTWQDSVVAVLFNRHGQVIQSKRLADIVVSKKDRARIRQFHSHFQWLEGVSGIRGKPPRVNSQNKVALEIIGGKTYTLSF
jgi:hypothetical protein